MTFSEKLKALRAKERISQRELGEAIGISTRSIASYEGGESYPNFEQLPKIASYFGITIDSLMSNEEVFVARAYEQGGRRGAVQAAALVDEVAGLFAGGRLTDQDMDAAMKAIQDAYWVAKEESRQKYTPKRYRRSKAQLDSSLVGSSLVGSSSVDPPIGLSKGE
jgi:transcriptional regulator with XRE-family HTH domain